MILIALLANAIEVQFEPVQHQVAIIMETTGQARDNTPYHAFKRFDLEPGQAELVVPRDPITPGIYLLTVRLVVNPTPPNPTKEHTVGKAYIDLDR